MQQQAKSISALVVDDEQPARERMGALLEEVESFNVTVEGFASSGKEALELLKEAQPDVVFLDIQMPGLDGIDVAGMLKEPAPAVIFVTAYDDYALKAFEVHAVDYLLKPVRKERLEKGLDAAIQRAPSALQFQKALSDIADPDKIAVNHKQEILLLETREVLWFEADGKYSEACTTQNQYIADYSLEQLEEKFSRDFYRVHRSYLVNLHRIQKLIPWFNNTWKVQMEEGTKLDVARRRMSGLKERLGI